MGDRANVYMLEGESRGGSKTGVYLYTHWGGTELPHVVQRALARRQRWDDSQYLARIVFCEMVRGYEDEETGFGISAGMGDNEHPILVVDCRTSRVSFCRANGFGSTPVEASAIAAWPFERYVGLDPHELDEKWLGAG